MGKSKSAKVEVTNYYMSLHFGIACGPIDALTALTVNEKIMWEGSAATETAIPIYNPDLFGGAKKEGGVAGTAHFLPGGSTQVMPEHLASKMGRTTATCPAYRGIASVFFHGATTDYNAFDPASGYGGQGFLWSSNNPIIAQSLWATVRRSPKGLDPTKAMIGTDANPAHMIFECLTNTDWGLGLSSSLIDGASFSACGDILYEESFGLSMIWTKQAKVEDFIGEIIDHIQANFYINPRTGLYTLKLIRDDYDPADLRVMNPDNADLSNFQRKMWGETINEIAVTWTNPVNEQEETVTLQNLAAVSAQGAPVPDSRNYYGVRNSELASRLAARDLRVSSAPLATMEVELNRTAWDLLPGEVVKVTWPEYELYDLVMRVGTVDYGKIGDPTIKATLMEDVFSLEKPTTPTQPDTNWVRPGETPAPMAHTKVITLPQFFVTSTDLQAGTLDLEYPEVAAAVLAHQTGYDTPTYELLSEQTLANGDIGYQSIGTKTALDRVTLSNSMVVGATTVLPGEDVAGVLIGPQVGGFVFIGDGTEAEMEVALVDSYDGLDWTLARGVLDTIPRAWPAGTPLWFVNSGARITDDQDIRAVGESPDYKLLSRTSLGILPQADAPVITGTMTARPHLPLRPGNVKVNGQAFGSIAIGGSTNVTITWGTRNRLLEDGQVVRWDAGSVSPEYGQETVVSIYNQSGTLVYEQGSLWTETSLVLPKTNFDRYSSITVLVRSRRDGLWSLQGHSVQVTGLANNPAAALPPSPPAATTPPPTTSAPGAGVFTATGTAVSSASGASTPTVLIVGTPDNADATGLVIRYRKSGSSDYTFHPTVDLRAGVQVRVAIAPLAALTDYLFEVAYEVGNQPLGGWRSVLPSPVTTGAFVSDNAVAVGTRTAVTLLAQVDQALADAASALAATGQDAADLSAAIASANAARDAAQAAQAAAETARNQAQSAYTAADAARGLAVDAKNLAASSATAAANSATSAAGSASTATTKATEAGTSATSASGFANTASTKASEAATSAGAAATSATSAASSSSLAGSNASAANTARVAAEAARDTAIANASAAATSASSAAASNTAAGSNASAANTAATQAATSASNASTSATNASTSATNAAGSASTAASQAVLASNYQAAALQSVQGIFPTQFRDTKQWSDEYDALNLTATLASSDFSILGDGTPVWSSVAGVTRVVAPTASFAPIVGRTYRVTLRARRIQNTTNGRPAYIWVGLGRKSTSGIYTSDPSTGFDGNSWPLSEWQTLSADVTITDPSSWARPRFHVNWDNGTGSSIANAVFQLGGTTFEDVTSQVASAGSASAAATSASVATTKAGEASSSANQANISATSATTSANTATVSAGNATTAATSASSSAAAASASAAAASSSATLSASIGGGTLNPNPMFANYPTSPGIPASWSDWADGGIGTRATGEAGSNAYRVVVGAGVNQGISRAIYLTSGWYVFEADVWIEAGSSQGGGMLVSGPSSNFMALNFTSDADLSGYQGAGGLGIRRWRKLVYYPVAETVTFYTMSNWDGLGTRAAKTINWFRSGIRPASQAEIDGAQAKAGVASANATIAANAATQATINAAQATTNTNLQATVNDNTASLTTQGGVLADLTGKSYSRYMVEANAAGVITGIYLVSSMGEAGTPISAIKLRADTFAVVAADESATKFPFVYDAALGKLVLNDVVAQSANIGDLAVTTLKLNGLAVTTDKIQNNAVTNSVSVSSSLNSNINTAGEQTLNTVSIETSGGRVELLANVTAKSNGGGGARYDVRVYRDGNMIFQMAGGFSTYADGSGLVTSGSALGSNVTISTAGQPVPMTLPLTDYPGPGTHTYQVRLNRVASGGGAVETLYNYLMATEIKR